MKKFKSILFAMIMALVVLVSCSKDIMSDGENAAEGNITLTVLTRAQGAGTTEMTVASPINIYVFDATGKCVGLKSVDSESDVAEFKLAEGVYFVSAIAGADANSYNLPDKENASQASVVVLKAGKVHGDIMCAQSTARLVEGEDTEVILNMERKVFMLRNITVNDVPEDVKAITAVIKPLYENVSLSGDYSGENGEQTVVLEKNNNGVWTKLCNLFLMKSIGNAVVEFSFQMSDGKTRTFSYSADKPLEANYKIDLNVNYLTVAEPLLKCSIKGVAWSGETTWNIDINERDIIESGGSNVIVDGEVPSEGSLYKGCYVLKSEASLGSNKIINVLLLAPKQANSLTFTDGDQSSIRSSIDAAIDKLAVEGIGGWRLPTTDEISYIMDNAKDINNKLPSSITQIFTSSYNYFYISADNTIKAMNSSKESYDSKSGRASYYVRPVAPLVFLLDK